MDNLFNFPNTLAPAPELAPSPAEAPRIPILAPGPPSTRVTRSAAAAGLLPAAAPALTPIREGSRESEESYKSISEERELQELLDNLDGKFLNNEEIMKMLESIDIIIDTEDFSSLDKINETLQPYGITITSENISINIAQEK